jgi:hypothetical protein
LAHLSTVLTPPAPAAKKTQRGLPAALPGAGISEEKTNSADVQRSEVHISGFNCIKQPSRRYTFGEFDSLAVALRRR